MNEKERLVLTEANLIHKIHTFRGVQVMLDYDLAAIYGYETRYFNRQVNNNKERFDQDFMFQLSREEFQNLMCKNFTSSWGGTRKLPFAFTEQGIYMLMTVLKGDLAVQQSKALIRPFKQMKDYIFQSQNVLSSPDLLKLVIQTQNNTENIRQIKQDLSAIMDDFNPSNIKREYLFYNGQTTEAAMAYTEIYSTAKKSIIIIDNYIGLKTLVMLKSVPNNVRVTIFSDNTNRSLHTTEWSDFRHEYPNVNITIKTTGGIFHDRYIIIDHATAEEKIYHCGGSSKDGGKRITSITKVEDVMLYKELIDELQDNPFLRL